ncbi:50S ribosomal protein L21 [Candidatus Curtissbacteria bacterium]|nr:50S ribosomal protein L21 [Candidatus Curtissbacteria bacterium]
MDTWAVIATGGKQYKAAEGDQLAIEKIQPDKNGKITFSEVLLVKSDVNLEIGKPFVEKAKVVAKVIEDFKDKKIRVVKFKPKSKYLRTTGHRQFLTRVLIEKIQA